MTKNPKVSIIMGVYNCAPTLARSVESLISQTFTDWELIMCDDGSQDDSYTIARQLQQKLPAKIIVLKNEKNLGSNATLNHCLTHATGKYIALQDADDVSLPERLQLEVDFLDQHPDYAVVSGGMARFDENGIWASAFEIEYPTMKNIFFGAPFCHPAAMMRKQALAEIGNYSVAPQLLRVEDYHLWYKFYRAGFKGHNLQQTIYVYADDQSAYQRRNFRNRLNETNLKRLIIKEQKYPLYYHLYALRPLLVGLLPASIYHFFRRRRLQS
ncbi:glycosyltransferase family 2 protein [Lapidilactobacillus bayanensis]|uniref:glycosyltransferase family 2 protein n=1 Tax=Lapidilactobacillus bayanensis TaxID=2485998 RepID=UPI000F7B971F|nr:glycosyltransferase family 2 protein [Lapidilactobacillus bayanensis]